MEAFEPAEEQKAADFGGIMQDYESFNVKLDATHSHMKMRLAEVKFDRRWTIADIKQQMERRFGSAPENQSLQLKSSTDVLICELSDDSKTLEQYGAADGQCIHVIDSNPSANFGEFEDVSKVEKYVMADADYAKRDDTFRKFRERQLAANPNFKSYLGQVDKDHQKEEAQAIETGQRCETCVGAKRGEVMYVGKVPGLERGYWVGVKLDEPTGDSDGKVKEKTYFECAPKFGLFVRPADLKVGDYPEIDIFDEDDDMI